MKATGIVIRIDDLGRVVIPKEIRKKFNIQEGDLLEIFTVQENDKDMVVFAPYFEGEPEQVRLNLGDFENTISEIDSLSNEVCAYAPNDMIDRLREIAESFKNLLPKEE